MAEYNGRIPRDYIKIAHIKTAFDLATSLNTDWQDKYDFRIKGGRTLYDIAGQSRTGCSVYFNRITHTKKYGSHSTTRYVKPETEVEMVKRKNK